MSKILSHNFFPSVGFLEARLTYGELEDAATKPVSDGVIAVDMPVTTPTKATDSQVSSEPEATNYAPAPKLDGIAKPDLENASAKVEELQKIVNEVIKGISLSFNDFIKGQKNNPDTQEKILNFCSQLQSNYTSGAYPEWNEKAIKQLKEVGFAFTTEINISGQKSSLNDIFSEPKMRAIQVKGIQTCLEIDVDGKCGIQTAEALSKAFKGDNIGYSLDRSTPEVQLAQIEAQQTLTNEALGNKMTNDEKEFNLIQATLQGREEIIKGNIKEFSSLLNRPLEEGELEEILEFKKRAENQKGMSLANDEVIELYEVEKALSPEQKENKAQLAVRFNKMGDKKWEMGAYKNAEEYYKKAIEYDVGNDLYHNSLGDALYVQGENAQAEEAYREAIRLNPNKGTYKKDLGNTLYAQKRYEEAEKAYLQSGNEDIIQLYKLEKEGDKQVETSDFTAAADSYKKALEVATKAKMPEQFQVDLQGKIEKAS